MTHSTGRRRCLLGLAAVGAASAFAPAARAFEPLSLADQLKHLEDNSGGRLGVAVIDTHDNTRVGWRENERFPMCSTFKIMLASAILARGTAEPTLLRQRLHYRQSELVAYSPVTEKHLADGMTVIELCAAALQYSDNSASNFLMKLIGGPAGVTRYARSIGDQIFRLDRWETELNSALPGDARDSTSPDAMARSLRRLALGDALGAPQRRQLADWLRGNTTGDTRIRAGAPQGWQVGDKTGAGAYGTVNDIGVLWRPNDAPLVLALYYTREEKDAPVANAVLAQATRLVTAVFR